MGKCNRVREAKCARDTHPLLSRTFNCSTPILLSTKQNYLPQNSPCKCYKPFPHAHFNAQKVSVATPTYI